jgi:hypothetical protein
VHARVTGRSTQRASGLLDANPVGEGRPDGAPEHRRCPARDHPYKEQGGAKIAGPNRAAGIAFQLHATDLAAEVERLRAAAVTFRSDIIHGIGGDQVLIEDPSGNPIELFAARAPA